MEGHSRVYQTPQINTSISGGVRSGASTKALKERTDHYYVFCLIHTNTQTSLWRIYMDLAFFYLDIPTVRYVLSTRTTSLEANSRSWKIYKFHGWKCVYTTCLSFSFHTCSSSTHHIHSEDILHLQPLVLWPQHKRTTTAKSMRMKDLTVFALWWPYYDYYVLALFPSAFPFFFYLPPDLILKLTPSQPTSVLQPVLLLQVSLEHNNVSNCAQGCRGAVNIFRIFLFAFLTSAFSSEVTCKPTVAMKLTELCKCPLSIALMCSINNTLMLMQKVRVLH